MGDSEVTARETFAGSAVEIDAAGDYLVNTHDALNGDVRFQLASGRALVVEISGKPVFHVSRDGDRVRIDLGDGSTERLVLGDAFMKLLNDFFQQKFDLHTHPTPAGPSGPPLPPFTGTQMSDAQLSSIARTKQT